MTAILPILVLWHINAAELDVFRRDAIFTWIGVILLIGVVVAAIVEGITGANVGPINNGLSALSALSFIVQGLIDQGKKNP